MIVLGKEEEEEEVGRMHPNREHGMTAS